MEIIIPIKDDPNHTLIIQLDDNIFKFGFLYNTISDSWGVKIWDSNDNLLITGARIVANYPLIFNRKNESFPKGDLFCETSNPSVSIGRESFSSGETVLIFISNSDF